MYYFDNYAAFILQERSDVLEIVHTYREMQSLSLGDTFKR